MKWKWFSLAAFIVACALIKQGIPYTAVVAGIAGAAIVNYLRGRKVVAS